VQKKIKNICLQRAIHTFHATFASCNPCCIGSHAFGHSKRTHWWKSILK